MSTSLPAARLRPAVTAYVGATAVVTLVFVLLNARAAHPWIIGEWLINYSGGFIRRGLLGQALLLLQRATGLPLVSLTGGLQMLLYAAFSASLLPLLRGLRWSLPLLALLLSPATLAFTVLDPPTSARKEVLLFLALSLLVYTVRFRRPRKWQLALTISIVAPLLVLTHEALAVFLPYLLLPLLLSTSDFREAARLALLPLLLTALALAFIVMHPGGSREAAAVCESVGGHLDQRPGGLCNGAIAYLPLTPAEARAETLRAIRVYHYPSRYSLPILLSALPIGLLLARRLRAEGWERATSLLLVLIGVSLLASLPLFVVARDWGRWVEIHATCLLLLFLLLECPQVAATQDVDAVTERTMLKRPADAALRHLQIVRHLQLAGLVLYATCWTLPAVGIYPGRFGYIDLVRYLHSYRSKPHLSTVVTSSFADQPAARHSAPAQSEP